MRRGADQRAGKPGARRLRSRPARQMHRVGAGMNRRIDILVNANDGAAAVTQYDEPAEQRAPFRRRQILLTQAEPAAPSREGRCRDFFERPARLAAVGDDQQRRDGKPHDDLTHGRGETRSSSASTVTRILLSPGSATGAGAAIAAKRGTGEPPVSALPTWRSR